MNPYPALIVYIVILHLAPVLRLRGLLPFGRTAFIVDAATIITMLLTVKYFRKNLHALTGLDRAVMGFGLLSVFSLVAYFQRDAPTDILGYAYGIHYGVMPIFCYFAMKAVPLDLHPKVLAVIIGLNLFAMAVGIYLYYVRPDWYSVALLDYTFMTADEDMSAEWRLYARLQSYLGSTAVGTLSAATLLAILLIPRAQMWLIVAVPLLVTSAILSKQRGGIVATAFALLVVVFADRRALGIKILSLVAGVGFLVYSLDALEERYEGSIGYLMTRSKDFDTIFQGRGYGPGLEYLSDWPLGVGLGATLSSTEHAGLASRGQVVDANFMRIAADLGVQGLILFLVVLFFAFKSAIKYRTAAVGLILTFVIVCLGTNTLDSHLVVHCFWMFLGHIDQTVSEKHAEAASPIAAADSLPSSDASPGIA